LPSPPARTISFPQVRTTTLGQSVYLDVALHISNYYINMLACGWGGVGGGVRAMLVNATFNNSSVNSFD
jgi:hypothetical protein